MKALLSQAGQRDPRALARLLTLIEREGLAALKVKELLSPTHQAFRVGITGPPGAGKSTLVNQLLTEFRRQELLVGVLAVDPSSPFSGGAVLGDRVRYVDHALDSKVFIRSLGTRGSLGGLSGSAYLMLRAFDHFGFDLVVIETVGVGQTELEVVHVADFVTVVLVPESGDSVQMMKAGLLEIADQFVVNKVDRPGADGVLRELESLAHQDSKKSLKVYGTVALAGQGVSAVAGEILSVYRAKTWLQRRASPERLRAEARALLRQDFEDTVTKKLKGLRSLEDFRKALKV